MAEGLWLSDKSILSRLINDTNEADDSCFRINHYPPFDIWNNPASNLINQRPNDDDDTNGTNASTNRVGFGEHSDPQILTILRSNDVGGLQICSPDGLWIPVPPNPSEFCVFVGDALQVIKLNHQYVVDNSFFIAFHACIRTYTCTKIKQCHVSSKIICTQA